MQQRIVVTIVLAAMMAGAWVSGAATQRLSTERNLDTVETKRRLNAVEPQQPDVPAPAAPRRRAPAAADMKFMTIAPSERTPAPKRAVKPPAASRMPSD